MNTNNLFCNESHNVRSLYNELVRIGSLGFVPAVGKGSTSIGVTLLTHLGIDLTSSKNPVYLGTQIRAYRLVSDVKPCRVNLFAKVPDWKISECKSSAEILQKYGYVRDDVLKLNCTVTSTNPNSQGLMLEVDRMANTLNEFCCKGSSRIEVAKWSISKLSDRLLEKHPTTFWVGARQLERDGITFFRYETATFTSNPDIDFLPELLTLGTITIDHVINQYAGGKVVEKGPLFKVAPSNLPLLFGPPKIVSLRS